MLDGEPRAIGRGEHPRTGDFARAPQINGDVQNERINRSVSYPSARSSVVALAIAAGEQRERGGGLDADGAALVGESGDEAGGDPAGTAVAVGRGGAGGGSVVGVADGGLEGGDAAGVVFAGQ